MVGLAVKVVTDGQGCIQATVSTLEDPEAYKATHPSTNHIVTTPHFQHVPCCAASLLYHRQNSCFPFRFFLSFHDIFHSLLNSH